MKRRLQMHIEDKRDSGMVSEDQKGFGYRHNTVPILIDADEKAVRVDIASLQAATLLAVDSVLTKA